MPDPILTKDFTMDIIQQRTETLKLRADSIIIRNPKAPGQKSVHMDLMLEPWDADAGDYTAGDARRVNGMSVPLTDARYQETATITDPVTGQEITISVAGIAAAVEAVTVGWIANPPKPEAEDE